MSGDAGSSASGGVRRPRTGETASQAAASRTPLAAITSVARKTDGFAEETAHERAAEHRGLA
jgi:hypothetical protein